MMEFSMEKIFLALILGTTVELSACQTNLGPNVQVAKDPSDPGSDEQFDPSEFNRQLYEFISKSETFSTVPSSAKNP
jgi:hypothetical protein